MEGVLVRPAVTIVVPFLGVLVYLIARGHSMTDRDVLRAAARDIRTMMRRQQAEASYLAGSWVAPPAELLALAV